MLHFEMQAAGRGQQTTHKEIMKNTKLILLALALGCSTWIVNAQTGNVPGGDDQGPPPGDGPPPGQGRGGHRPPPPLIAVLDANHDGIIDADEIANASAALKTLDKNGDGRLTPDEYMPPMPPRRDGPDGPGNGTNRPPAPPIVAALDANGDGIIDADEIANAPAALKTLDKNGDGKLTPDEFRPPHPFGRGGPGGPGERRARGGGDGPGPGGPDVGGPPRGQ
jgi:hypothetical protein